MDSMTNIVFTVIRQQIDFDNQKYLDICEARRVAGSQGGRPSKSLGNKGNKPKKANGFENEEEKANGFSEKQTKAKKPESDTDTDNDNDSDNIESKKERNLYINNNQGVCACESQETYENIINHYAGDIDEETRAAIWKYIQYFQAKTGCFILNEQLKTFLRNVKDNSLLFEGGVLGCMNSDGIGMALMDMND